MDEYLPPVVTRLRGDWSDLRATLLESAAAMKAWAAAVRADVVDALQVAGHDAGTAFAKALRESASKEFDGFENELIPKLRSQGGKAAASAAESFVSVFKAAIMPGLIAVLVMATPAIGAAIGAAVTTGFGLGLVGLGIFLLREQPAVVEAAKKMKDSIKAVFTDAALPLLPHVLEAMQRLARVAAEVGPHFKEIFAIIGPVIPNIVDGLGMFLTALMPGLKEAAPLMADMVAAFAGWGQDIGAGLSEFLKAMVDAGPELWRSMVAFGQVLGDVIGKTGQLIALLAKVHDFTERGRGKGFGFMGGPELLIAAWPKVVQGAKDAWEWIKKVADAVGEWVTGRAGDVAGWWNGMVEAVQTKGRQVTDWFEALPDRIGDFLAALPGKLRDAAVAGFDHFFFTLGFIGGKLIEWVDKTATFFKELPTRIGLLVGQLWTDVKNKFTAGVTDTTLAVGNWAERIPGILDKLMADFAAWGRRTWETVTNWVHTTVTDVLKWWDSLPGRISAINDKIISSVKGWATSAVGWLFNAGKNMIQGLIDGAIAATGGAIAAIMRAVQRIIDGAKRALGIASPSTVFAEMGRFSMLGFVEGLQGERGMLARAWAGLTPTSPVVGAAASPAMALAAAAGQGAGGQPLLVQLFLDSDLVDERLIEKAQQRKGRTGTTGYS